MQINVEKDKIVIVDFGSQVTKLIARRIRDLGVYSEIITLKECNNIKDGFIKNEYILDLEKSLMIKHSK